MADPIDAVLEKAAKAIKMLFLKLRSRCGWIWRLGIIRRGTAFRWDMDAMLGEYTKSTPEDEK